MRRRRHARGPRVADPAALQEAAIRELEQGHGRRAANVLDQARRAHIVLPDAELLACCCRAARREELRRAGLHKEADALAAPPVDAKTVAAGSEAARAVYMLFAPANDLVDIDVQAVTPAALQAWVDRWMLARAGRADAPPPPQVAPHAQAMREARDQMRSGRWRAAAEALGKVERRSPLAAWRLLALALGAHADGAPDQAAAAAGQAARLAGNFALMPVLAVLMGDQAAAPEDVPSVRRRRQVRALLDENSRVLAGGRALIDQLAQPSFAAESWAQDVRRLARLVCPDNAAAAVHTILATLWVDVRRKKRTAQRFLAVLRDERLPEAGKQMTHFLVISDLSLVELGYMPEGPDFAGLPGVFGDGEAARLVRAQLLARLSRQLRDIETDPHFDEDDRLAAQKAASSALAARPAGKRPLSIDLMEAAVTADPQDLGMVRELDAAWAAEPTSAARRRRLKLWRGAQRALPDELAAPIALARLHLEDDQAGAAVKILTRAAAVAGGDGPFADLWAVAEARLALGSMPPARARLRWAVGHCRGDMRPFIHIACLAAQLDDGAMAVAGLAEALAATSGAARLRMLGLVRCLSRRASVRGGLGALLRRASEEIEAEAVASLFAPPPADVLLLFGTASPTVAGLAPVLPRLLPHLSAGELLVVAPALLAGGADAAVARELRRRRRGRAAQPSPDLNFLGLFLDLRRRGTPELMTAIVMFLAHQDATTMDRLSSAAAALAPLAPRPARPLLARVREIVGDINENFALGDPDEGPRPCL